MGIRWRWSIAERVEVNNNEDRLDKKLQHKLSLPIPIDACLSSRSYALSQRPKIKFVPKCREDGTYAPIQCLENNGCWCVNAQGKPIQKTHTQHGRPNCTGKANQKRSSPGAPRKRCSPQDRVSFNTGLMNIFNAENSKSRAGISMGDPQIIEWKFKQLDVNGNDVLEKSEYQGLKKIAKTVSRWFFLLITFNLVNISKL